MAKSKYQKYPRAIVQSRPDHPTSLTVTVPKAIVQQMSLRAGDIFEFVFVTEGFESYIKVRFAKDD